VLTVRANQALSDDNLNFFGSAVYDSKSEKLHTDPESFVDDEIAKFFSNPDRYVADTLNLNLLDRIRMKLSRFPFLVQRFGFTYTPVGRQKAEREIMRIAAYMKSSLTRAVNHG
jgi:hypothetical protein